MKTYIIGVLMIFAMLGLIYKSITADDKDDIYGRCLSRCTDRGYQKNYCTSRCSPSTEEDRSGTSSKKLSDQQCMTNCRMARRDQAYCTKACTFY